MNTAFERTDQKDEWITPRHITDALGHIDLDPCAPITPPWEISDFRYDIRDDGLLKPWNGFVFCNPPYGTQTKLWLKRMKEYAGGGIALIFARTDTKMFHDYIFDGATSILFIKGRLSFCDVTGKKGGTAGAPSCLVAYGEEAHGRLKSSGIKGKLLRV